MIRRFALAFTAMLVLTVPTLTGCNANRVDPYVPTNIEIIQSTEPGSSLKTSGYTPVTNIELDSSVVGHVYIACGTTTNITECSSNRHNRGTTNRPNVYIKNKLIKVLEGPTVSDVDTRTYYVTVPAHLQDFATLTPALRTTVLEQIMPEAIALLGSAEGEKVYTLNLSVGVVEAWVSHNEPKVN